MIVLVTAWFEAKELAVIVNLFKPTTIPWTQSNEQFTTWQCERGIRRNLVTRLQGVSSVVMAIRTMTVKSATSLLYVVIRFFLCRRWVQATLECTTCHAQSQMRFVNL